MEEELTVNDQLVKLHQEMDNIALANTEQLARECLAQNPKKLKEFVMGMGTFFFTDKKGTVLYNHETERLPGYKALDDFVCEWNSTLKLTGEPMRFTATGIKITEW